MSSSDASQHGELGFGVKGMLPAHSDPGGEFDFNLSVKLYREIWDLVEGGTDIRDISQEHYAGVNFERFIPRDPKSNKFLSLGSVFHFSENCQPCSFVSSGRCRKMEYCLYCHVLPHFFAPPMRPSKRRRDRWRRQRKKGSKEDPDQMPTFEAELVPENTPEMNSNFFREKITRLISEFPPEEVPTSRDWNDINDECEAVLGSGIGEVLTMPGDNMINSVYQSSGLNTLFHLGSRHSL
eukprot:gnl/MRDRNA2_/MRDRNA2_85920_c0_seq4.p1 gnl/MRDRNA2_/MRDRNA2_85920_c0~~gnl/MRDRNA2_/MRDRNA2_85920_c0_seq4.p1  ORF type:complete len:263 (-),score=33.60 gnl/MRDRNA2_/MRDRNA2_85920_c0_seq4:637-1350(-)